MSNSKKDILEAATLLFSEKGYDAVGVSEIVAAAGVTKPTMYYFFQSKEGVLKEILEEKYGGFIQHLKNTSFYQPNLHNYYEDVYPVFKKIVMTYFTFAKQNSVFYSMLLSLTFAPPTAVTTVLAKPYFEEQYKIMRETFLAMSKYHGNLKGNEFLFACNFIALINANIGFWYQGYGDINEQKADSIVKQYMHGIFS